MDEGNEIKNPSLPDTLVDNARRELIVGVRPNTIFSRRVLSLTRQGMKPFKKPQK